MNEIGDRRFDFFGISSISDLQEMGEKVRPVQEGCGAIFMRFKAGDRSRS